MYTSNDKDNRTLSTITYALILGSLFIVIKLGKNNYNSSSEIDKLYAHTNLENILRTTYKNKYPSNEAINEEEENARGKSIGTPTALKVALVAVPPGFWSYWRQRTSPATLIVVL